VHAHAAVALALGRLMPEVPLVYTIHHDRVKELAEYYPNFPEAYFVAISADQASREAVMPRLSVIHHGLNPDVYQWTEKPADYVSFVGRFAEVKGPHTAIDAAARAGVPIRIAGEVHSVDGPFGEREVLPRLREPHVRYLGNIGIEEKVPLLRDARALLVPITWNEPFGLAIIEAMLSGCPVVAFPRGSVPELVEEGVTGFIARDPEEMAELIRPGGALERFDRERCRERAVERFSRERMVVDYERLYERAASESATTAPLRLESGGVA
jgi:glycosyltransferase involved in cell wall biosynthesis